MGTNYNPRIVTSGLVLALDGANTKSFKGEPTVNVIANPDFSSGTTSWGAYTITPTTVTVSDVPRTYGIARSVLQCVTSSTLNGGGNYGGTTQGSVSTTAGLSYTLSYYARSLSGSLFIRFSNQTGSGDESNLSHISTVTSAWTKFTRTVTLDLAKSQIYFYNQSNSIAGATFQIADVQLEQKAYATQFAVGTRGATVATNGGWADLSGNSNHGTLVNAPTESTVGGGCIVFDGTDDYIDLGSGIQLTNNFTLSVWHKDGNTGYVIDQGELGTDFTDRLEWTNYGLTLSTNNNNNVIATGTITAANWNNVVVTFASGATKFYINGNLDSSPTAAFTSFLPGGSILKIARRAFNTASIYSGKIGNVSIYSRVLTAAEVKQNFAALRGRYGV